MVTRRARQRSQAPTPFRKSRSRFSRCGGIGRHAVLRGQWRELCRFESGHQKQIKGLSCGTAPFFVFDANGRKPGRVAELAARLPRRSGAFFVFGGTVLPVLTGVASWLLVIIPSTVRVRPSAPNIKKGLSCGTAPFLFGTDGRKHGRVAKLAAWLPRRFGVLNGLCRYDTKDQSAPT